MTEGFYNLTPDNVLDAVEEAGFTPTGEMTQLNSYENRVFDIRVEKNAFDLDSVVTKFYRPGRWKKEAIQDEHDFLKDLNQESIPAVSPLVLKNKNTILEFHGMYVSVFPKIKARMPQEFLGKDLESVGLLLAKLHNVGAQKKASHRKLLTSDSFGWESLDLLQPWISSEVRGRYNAAAEKIFFYLDDELDETAFIRIHGDCHKGNLLNTGREFFFVDFDDFCNGPVAQDFWMLLSGDDLEQEMDKIMAGYEQIRQFNWDDIHLFEPLRGLRIVYYARWIATRWDDPSFPRLFPQFQSYSYWAEEVEALEKIAWSL